MNDTMNSVMHTADIDSVQIYRQGALVRRKLHVNNNNKHTTTANTISIGGLPLSMLDQSLRVWCAVDTTNNTANEKDSTHLPIASGTKISLQRELHGNNDTHNDDLKKQDEIEKLSIHAEALEERKTRCMESIEKLDALKMPKRHAITKLDQYTESPHAARLQLLQFIGQRRKTFLQSYHTLSEKLHILQQQKRQIKESLNNNEHTQQTHIMNNLKKKIDVRLRHSNHNDVEIPAFDIIIEYHVSAAAWAPSYSLYVHDAQDSQHTQQAHLEMRALITQSTGEDWSGVQLRLSTASLQQWCELPEMNSLRIGRQVQSTIPTGYREPPRGCEELFLNYDQFQSLYADDISRKSLPEEMPVAVAPMAVAGFSNDYDVSEEQEMAAFGAGMSEQSLDDIMDEEPSPNLSFSESAAPMSKSTSKNKKSMRQKGSAAAPDITHSMAPPPDKLLGALAEDEPESEPDFHAIKEDFLHFQSLHLADLTHADRGRLRIDTEDTQHSYSENELCAMYAAYSQKVSGFPSAYTSVGNSNDFDYAFDCRNRVQVPTDGKFHSIAIMEQHTAMDSYYVAVPREQQDVFRMANIKNPFKNPLLSGPLDLYKNNEFFISSSLNMIAPGGDVDIGLGVEEGIKIARNTQFEEETTGMLSGHLSLHHHIHIEVQNNLAHDIRLELRERIPTAHEKEEDITISVADINPPWKDSSPDLVQGAGRHHWDLHIDAHAKSEVSFHYTLKLSAKNQIVGGNRREV